MKNVILLILAASFSCSAQTASTNGDQFKTGERQKLKNFAFCSCLNATYPKMDSVFKDGSSSGYFETSGYSVEAFPIVARVAKQAAQKTYGSKYKKKLGMMKCLDFYNSKELNDLVVGLDSLLNMSSLK